MNRKEVIEMIKRNGYKKARAVVFISDFLNISRKEAKEIYKEEFENV